MKKTLRWNLGYMYMSLLCLQGTFTTLTHKPKEINLSGQILRLNAKHSTFAFRWNETLR